MSRLVYWYGTPVSDGPYSFVKKSIIPYDEGVKRNMHKLPANIQEKIGRNRKLTKLEQQLYDALEEIKKDLIILPEKRWERDFYELYELKPNDEISGEHEVVEDEEAISQSSRM